MKENKKKKLVISTNGFPYGETEISFLDPELDELIKHFEVVLIAHCPDQANDGVKKNVYKGCKVYNIDIQLAWYARIKYGIQFFFDKDGWREVGLILKTKKNFLPKLYQSIAFFAFAMENYRLMEKMKILPKENEEFIYYTYWYVYYTYSMTKNRKHFRNTKIITRTHGFDLFDERCNGGRQPFKNIMDEQLDHVFFVAAQGRAYYLNKYNKEVSEKYIVSRLGTLKIGSGSTHRDSVFRLVSCSSIIPLKRVDLLIKALSLLDREIEWIHFGTGTDAEKIENLANIMLSDKENIMYKLKGFVANDKIMEYYNSHYVNCFVSTSSTEGLPVSIQEAMSFGIPIIATDVGGVSELIADNGILLPANPTEQQIAEVIKSMMDMDEERYFEIRNNSYTLWQEKYDAEKNRRKFAEQLKEI